MDYIMVFITVPNRDEAENITKVLLDEKLAAGVSSMAGLSSKYWWEGKIESAQEIALVIRTKIEVLGEIVERVRKMHPYKVPEITAVPIIGGNRDYLDWIEKSVK